MSEQKIPIPAMLYNAAVGGHVTNSQQIIDEDYNLEQKDVNKEVLGVPYNSTTPNGMGRIVLKKNDNFKQVVEAQTNGNTIFVIKYDYTLTGNVTVPANCILEFDGGSIDGGGTAGLGNGHTITFNNTVVTKQKNGFTNCRFAGTLTTQQVFMSTFGVVADGLTDDAYVIQDVIDCAYGKSCEVFFDCDGDYIIGSTSHHADVGFKSKTVYNFTGKGFIKLAGNPEAYTRVGSVTGSVNTEDVVINNIKIDGNYQFSGGTGENGFSCAKTKNLRINGGVIKNCMRGQAELINNEYVVGPGLGGKGIQTENSGNQNLEIDGVSFYDCSIAISCKTDYSDDGFAPQIMNFTNIYAENCPTFLYAGLQNGNDLDPSILCVKFENITVKNCGWYKYGVADEWHPNDYIGEDPSNPNHSYYQDEGSVFTLDRATNLSINNAYVIGNKSAWNIFGGSHRNCEFTNIKIEQPCTTILSIDQGKFNLDYNNVVNVKYDFVVNCAFTYLYFNATGRTSFVNTSHNILFMWYPTASVVSHPGNLAHGGTNKVNYVVVANKESYDVVQKFPFTRELGYFIAHPVNSRLDQLDLFYAGQQYTDVSQTNYGFGVQSGYKSGDTFIPLWGSAAGGVANLRQYDGSHMGIPRSGNYADKPTSLPKPVPFVFYATDKGYPIFWTGDTTKGDGGWVKADGTSPV